MNIRKIMTATVASGAILVAGVGLAACGSSSDSTTTAPATTAPMESTSTVAASMAKVTGTDTLLTLDAATAKALTGAKITVSPVEPATADQGGIKFPIIGEEVDTVTLKSGVITHTGGLVFAQGPTTVEVKDFSVDLSTGILTAMLPEGAELPLLTLDTSAVKTDDAEGGTGMDVSGIKGALTKDAATALNNAFGTELFTEGLAIGTLDLVLATEDERSAPDDMSTTEGMEDMGTTPME